MPSINTNSKEKDAKYSKILNNLLDIRGRDQTIFTKVNGTENFDISTKFGVNYSEKVLSQKEFKLSLKEKDLQALYSDISIAQTAEMIIEAYEKYKEKLFNTKKILLNNKNTFLSTKNELLEKIDLKIQRATSRWSQYRRKIIDINIQDNIWPLHVATAFISINTNRRVVYAPLLLKEVGISLRGPNIIIESMGSWKINEKLVFLLSDYGFNIEYDEISIKEMTTFECTEYLEHQLNIILNKEQLLKPFDNLKTEEINNKQIKVHSGVVLGIFKPSGGHLRKTMMQIIEKNEIDQIIDVEVDKRIYEKNMINFIFEKSHELLKIQQSNYAQDKALASSLIQDTIIWGPPGTGKSQVIANVIANLLENDKSAVVMSQKKAALDVLKKRLGQIAPFALFILNDNKMIKAEFYKPLQYFIEMVENASYIEKNQKEKLINWEQQEMLELISKTKRNKSYTPSLHIIDATKGNLTLINLLFKINLDLNYPKKIVPAKEFILAVANINNINKKGFWIFKKYPKKIKKSAQIAIELLKGNIDISTLKEFILQTDYETTAKLTLVPQKLKKQSSFTSDEKYLAAKLGEKIITKINNWRINNYEFYKKYKKLANAIRAGRRLPYKFINDHIMIIRKLFPIIITTPETSFINWEKEVFDYAILDESSQMFLEIGLPILYLSKIKVLAGDTKQMQPSRWFATRDENEDEDDVVENADSLLDYAFDKGVHQVMLNQNYRSSSASLMAFSAKQFYQSKLEVINNAKKRDNKPIEVINVQGKWEKGINQIEVKKVIELTKENLNNYEKMIILTFNSNQRQLIEKNILEKEPKLYKALEEEKLAIRNIENIQGDEADLVIASVVYDNTTYIGSTYVARAGGKNALNVAISRARDRMIVVKSINGTDIRNANSEDFKVFRDWLLFLDMNEKKQNEYSNQNKYLINESFGETDSNFEREVIDELKTQITTREKYHLIKQYSVGSKSIDIAFIDDNGEYKIGIEVDGYKYHNGQGFDKYLADQSRQEFLEAKGYNIYRISEIDWKIRKEKIIFDIQNLLNAHLLN